MTFKVTYSCGHAIDSPIPPQWFLEKMAKTVGELEHNVNPFTDVETYKVEMTRIAAKALCKKCRPPTDDDDCYCD